MVQGAIEAANLLPDERRKRLEMRLGGMDFPQMQTHHQNISSTQAPKMSNKIHNHFPSTYSMDHQAFVSSIDGDRDNENESENGNENENENGSENGGVNGSENEKQNKNSCEVENGMHFINENEKLVKAPETEILAKVPPRPAPGFHLVNSSKSAGSSIKVGWTKMPISELDAALMDSGHGVEEAEFVSLASSGKKRAKNNTKRNKVEIGTGDAGTQKLNGHSEDDTAMETSEYSEDEKCTMDTEEKQDKPIKAEKMDSYLQVLTNTSGQQTLLQLLNADKSKSRSRGVMSKRSAAVDASATAAAAGPAGNTGATPKKRRRTPPANAKPSVAKQHVSNSDAALMKSGASRDSGASLHDSVGSFSSGSSKSFVQTSLHELVGVKITTRTTSPSKDQNQNQNQTASKAATKIVIQRDSSLSDSPGIAVTGSDRNSKQSTPEKAMIAQEQEHQNIPNTNTGSDGEVLVEPGEPRKVQLASPRKSADLSDDQEEEDGDVVYCSLEKSQSVRFKGKDRAKDKAFKSNSLPNKPDIPEPASVALGELVELQKLNEDLEKKLNDKELALSKLSKSTVSQSVQFEKREQFLVNALTQHIRECEQMRRRESKRTVAEKCDRLGKVVVQRSGTTLNEAWEDGEQLVQLDTKLTALSEKRERIERQRKELAKRCRRISSAGDSNPALSGDNNGSSSEKAQTLTALMPPPPTPMRFLAMSQSAANNSSDETCDDSAAYLAEQEEVLKLRLVDIRKEESVLSEERHRCEVEKSLLIREIKRQRDEGESRFSDMRILHGRYILTSLLGKGGFSEVFKAFDKETLGWVACKIHQLHSYWSEEKKANYIRHATREYNIHKALVHPRVVRLLDVFEIDPDSFCTVLEFCDGTDLEHHLKLNKILSEKEARIIMVQVFSGLAYLSQSRNRIIHYDLKPGNILIRDGEVKITDFGLSKIMSEHENTIDGMELTSQGAGTYWYLPPECFERGNQPPRISSKVDVWSAGVILYQMLFGKKPLANDMSQERIIRDPTILNADVEFPSKPSVSADAKDFISACLTKNQMDRPDIKTLLQHPFLRIRK